MKIKFTPSLTAIYIIIALSISVLFAFNLEVKMPYDSISDGELNYGSFHIMINILWLFISIGFSIWGLIRCDYNEEFSFL